MPGSSPEKVAAEVLIILGILPLLPSYADPLLAITMLVVSGVLILSGIVLGVIEYFSSESDTEPPDAGS